MSSHVLAEVAQTADDVVIIAHGRLVVQGTMDEVLARAAGGTRVRSPERRPAGAGCSAGEARRSASDGSLIVTAPPERVGEVAAANGVVLHELIGRAGVARGRLPRADRASPSERGA